jgi:hypothetical protein
MYWCVGDCVGDEVLMRLLMCLMCWCVCWCADDCVDMFVNVFDVDVLMCCDECVDELMCLMCWCVAMSMCCCLVWKGWCVRCVSKVMYLMCWHEGCVDALMCLRVAVSMCCCVDVLLCRSVGALWLGCMSKCCFAVKMTLYWRVNVLLRRCCYVDALMTVIYGMQRVCSVDVL